MYNGNHRHYEEQRVSIGEAEFRHVLGHFVSGVTVVTMRNGNAYHGLTVSSFCSLSLQPPLVLVCIDRRYISHELIANAGVFAVNMLAEDDEALSSHFASREPDKFATVAHHLGQTGVPVLDTALATLECQLVHQYPGGDHSIFVGEVIAANARDDVGPLVYYRSKYHRLC